MSLVARHLEQIGFPTVVIGSARDVVEQCGVARFLFTDFPLGNPCGRPYDRAMQREILDSALRLAETAFGPRTTVQAPQSWGDHQWRSSYMRVDEDNIEELRRMGRQRRQHQQVVKETAEDC